MGNHHSLFQVATALWDRAADVRFGYSHLGDITDKERLLLLQENQISDVFKHIKMFNFNIC